MTTLPNCPKCNSLYTYKVRNIRLTDGDHDIDCKIEGIGAMQLKSQFVKKV